MAYALHRRQAFRSVGGATGWGFDLTKSEYVDLGTIISSSSGSSGGTPISARQMFISADKSFFIIRPNTSGSNTALRKYRFPTGENGNISAMSNVPYTVWTRGLFYGSRVCCFSSDGIHYAQQGHNSDSTSTVQGIGRYDLVSCPLDAELDISSIPSTFANMSVLVELTSEARGLAFSADGLQLLVLYSGSIRSYYLQSAFDVSSASLSFSQITLSRFGVASNDAWDWQFSPDGYTLVTLHRSAESANATLRSFKMSVPFNITTISLDKTWELGTNYVNAFTIDRAGENIYISRSTTILQYSLKA